MLIAYARASTQEQVGPNKTTLDEQLAKCKAVAQLRGKVDKYSFATYTDPGVSGSVRLADRPGGREMLEQAKPGDIVLAAKMDRIFRSAVDALATIERFKKDGIGLILCDMGIEPVADSPSSELFFGMLANFAQFERARIRERITEGKRAKRSRGGHAGGPVPFGYRKLGAGSASSLVENETERAHAAAARCYARDFGSSPTRIASVMADRGMLGRNGKPYSRVAVWGMIQ